MSRADEPDRARITLRLREHLSDDRFVFSILRTAVTDVYSSEGHEKRLFWDMLSEALGSNLDVAVGRLADSDLLEGASQEDKDTVELGKRYAEGWRPKDALHGQDIEPVIADPHADG